MFMKKELIIVLAVIGIFAGGIYWSKSLQSKDPNVLAANGLHWHPTLEIFVGEEKVEIPQNIGLGAVHNPMHTHEDLPIIHLEFNSVVRKEDTKIKKFFEVWGKDINSFGETLTMKVNGEPNTELGDYEMKDSDKIVINYQ